MFVFKVMDFCSNCWMDLRCDGFFDGVWNWVDDFMREWC